MEGAASRGERLRAAAALARFAPNDQQWQRHGEAIAEELVSAPPTESNSWIIALLRPVGRLLTPTLRRVYETHSVQSGLAAAALADFVGDDADSLTALILEADSASEYRPLLRSLKNHGSSAFPTLIACRDGLPDADPEDDATANLKRRANAAICLLNLDQPPGFWPLLKHSPDPSLRSFLIDRPARLGADAELLANRVHIENDHGVLQALILTIARYDPLKLSSSLRTPLVAHLGKLFVKNPDPGVHGATQWSLQSLASNTPLAIDSEPDARWFTNTNGLGKVPGILRIPIALAKLAA